ncbi:MAG: 1-phosphofructokinase family hexose kinase [Chitinispirillaceae bacterium]
MIVCSLFNPAIDVSFRMETFEPGVTHLDLSSQAIPSGKGLNVARVVRTLGEEVAVAALVPEVDKLRFDSFFEDQGIKPLFFEVPGSTRINVTLSELQNECVTHLNSTSPSLSLRIQEEFLQFLELQIKQGSTWCFSGTIPAGFDKGVYSRVVSTCHEKGVDALLDTRGNALKLGLRTKPLMVKPNISELEELFDEQIRGVHHIALKGKRLIDMGISYAFVSLGSDGMIAIHGNDCLLCSPPQVKAVDTVGCGDALVAGILVAHSRKFSFSEICRMAIACGTSKCMHHGPGVVTRDEVWQLMEDVRITAI